MVRELKPRVAPLVTLALPGAVLACVLSAHLMLAAAGVHPMWRAEPLTISEAAALQDAATVLHRLHEGATAGERHFVRRGVLGDRAGWLTPLEAAIAGGHAHVATILLDASGPLHSDGWRRARCLAGGNDDLARALDAHRAADARQGNGELDCSDLAELWQQQPTRR